MDRGAWRATEGDMDGATKHSVQIRTSPPPGASLHPARHPTLPGRRRGLSWAPCVVQKLPVSSRGDASMSMLLFQFVPSSSSPDVSTRRCAMSASLITTSLIMIFQYI